MLGIEGAGRKIGEKVHPGDWTGKFRKKGKVLERKGRGGICIKESRTKMSW